MQEEAYSSVNIADVTGAPKRPLPAYVFSEAKDEPSPYLPHSVLKPASGYRQDPTSMDEGVAGSPMILEPPLRKDKNIGTFESVPESALVSPSPPALAPRPVLIPDAFSLSFNCLNTSKTIKSKVLELCSSQSHVLTKEDRANLTFLSDTIDLIVSYIDQQTENVKSIEAYRKQLLSLMASLQDTSVGLQRIIEGTTTITQNFEIYELALRRYIEMMKKMFPVGKVVLPPSVIIEDYHARQIWEKYAGRDAYDMPYDVFEHTLLSNELKSMSGNQNMRHYLRYFLNFPNDSLVTTYKWGLLTRLFGPFNAFTSNFQEVVLGRGFMGLINRIKARELLTLEPEKRVMLLRFSRTAPEFLAVSYKDDAGNVQHRINSNYMPLKEFLKANFFGYSLSRNRLNVKAAVGEESSGYRTLHEYAEVSAGYEEPLQPRHCK